MSRSLFLAAIGGFILSAGIARADTITSLTFSSDPSPFGNFTGIAEYNATAHDLTITIANGSSGAITGFGFNSADSGLSASLHSASTAGFSEEPLTSNDFGSYVFGAVGGNVTSAPGVFHFDITGVNAGIINVSNFFTPTISQPEPLIAEYGLNQFVGDVSPAAPLPPAAWAGLALLGVFGFAQRFSSRRLRTV